MSWVLTIFRRSSSRQTMPVFMLASVLLMQAADHPPASLNPSLHQYAVARINEFSQIPDERKARLDEIARYVRQQVQKRQPARLTFICTHNSRRSHLAQVWAKTAAEFFAVPGVETFSGGTEATAFNPRAASSLARAGFNISTVGPDPQNNPHYQLRFDDRRLPIECFSKVYDQPPNPQSNFCAVMVCAQADGACPLVAGAEMRIAVPYDDPKLFDGQPDESDRYDERCRQIAREMLYVFSKAAE
jgi:arsenate reductase